MVRRLSILLICLNCLSNLRSPIHWGRRTVKIKMWYLMPRIREVGCYSVGIATFYWSLIVMSWLKRWKLLILPLQHIGVDGPFQEERLIMWVLFLGIQNVSAVGRQNGLRECASIISLFYIRSISYCCIFMCECRALWKMRHPSHPLEQFTTIPVLSVPRCIND